MKASSNLDHFVFLIVHDIFYNCLSVSHERMANHKASFVGVLRSLAIQAAMSGTSYYCITAIL